MVAPFRGLFGRFLRIDAEGAEHRGQALGPFVFLFLRPALLLSAAARPLRPPPLLLRPGGILLRPMDRRLHFLIQLQDGLEPRPVRAIED